MAFRASSDYGLHLGFRLLVLFGPDRYPGIMDIYTTYFEVGRRKGCLEERSLPGTQVFFIEGVCRGTRRYDQEGCRDGD
jgi:hypothetical protein